MAPGCTTGTAITLSSTCDVDLKLLFSYQLECHQKLDKYLEVGQDSASSKLESGGKTCPSSQCTGMCVNTVSEEKYPGVKLFQVFFFSQPKTFKFWPVHFGFKLYTLYRETNRVLLADTPSLPIFFLCSRLIFTSELSPAHAQTTLSRDRNSVVCGRARGRLGVILV